MDTTSLLEQLGKACRDLEAHLKHAANDHVSWVEIGEHFRNMETVLKRKNKELVAKEKEFEAEEFETRRMLKEREAAISASEKGLLDRIQRIKDAAVADIVEARKKYLPASLNPVYDVHTIETEVISSLGDTNAHFSGIEEESPYKTGGRAGGVAVMVKPRPELVQLCERMDANGLLNFTMENQNILSVIRDELSVALKNASDPSRLVLDSLEGFFPYDESAHSVDPNDAAFEGMRQSCITIMEALATLLARAGPGAVHLLSPEMKQRANAIANGWKPKLANAHSDPTNINPLEAVAFLQLLVSFRIVPEFDEEELSKYVLAAASNEQTPGLCRSLGLTQKVPGIIEVLTSSGKQIEAVHFIHAFHLTERFHLVPLLKTYLREIRRHCQGRSGSGEALQNEVNARELAAINAVISCIKKYKLHADYPLDPLEKRFGQLERAKLDRKKSGDPSRRPSAKRQRSYGGEFGGYRGHGGAVDAAIHKHVPVYGEMAAAYSGQLERYPPHVAQNGYAYPVPNQSTYPQPTIDQRTYYYPPQDDRVAPPYNPVVPSTIPPTYGSYVGSGLQPTTQPYV